MSARMTTRMRQSLRAWVRWLFAGPVQYLPPPFGDPVPAHLKVFWVQAERARNAIQWVVQQRPVFRSRTKVAPGNVPVKRL